MSMKIKKNSSRSVSLYFSSRNIDFDYVVDQHYSHRFVYITPRSQVYHRLPCCCGTYFNRKYFTMLEDFAIMSGLRRCSKCDWDTPLDKLPSRHGLD